MKIKPPEVNQIYVNSLTPAPVPFIEEDAKEVFWPREAFDSVLPSPGFITDYVLATRGVETPTKFALWSAVFILSTALYRDAWLDWGPLGELFPNFYIILVAPPRICAKTSALSFGLKVLDSFPRYYQSDEERIEKNVTVVKHATPEALVDGIKSKKINIVIPGTNGTEDQEYTVVTDSKAGVVATELTTFLGKQKYNTGLIEQLTNLYDCLDHDSFDTISRGQVELKNIYLSIIGATTPDGINYSIPTEAVGGGFLSRLIIASEARRVRSYPYPRAVEGGPTRDDLSRRLAWIARNAKGAYYLSKEADAFYRRWYHTFGMRLAEQQEGRKAHLMQRMDNYIMKLSLILRVQRYEPGNEITLEDFQQAIEIVEATTGDSHELLSDVGVDFSTKAYNVVTKFLKKQSKKSTTRRKLLTNLSPRGIHKDTLDRTLRQLHEEGRLSIFLHGREQDQPSVQGSEIYYFIDEDKLNGKKKNQ